jgi:hypothetical protein
LNLIFKKMAKQNKKAENQEEVEVTDNAAEQEVTDNAAEQEVTDNAAEQEVTDNAADNSEAEAEAPVVKNTAKTKEQEDAERIMLSHKVNELWRVGEHYYFTKEENAVEYAKKTKEELKKFEKQ